MYPTYMNDFGTFACFEIIFPPICHMYGILLQFAFLFICYKERLQLIIHIETFSKKSPIKSKS